MPDLPDGLKTAPASTSPNDSPASAEGSSFTAGENTWSNSATVSERPVGRLECLTVLLLVVLADLAIYRGHGFAGWAALIAAMPWLLCLGSRRIPRSSTAWFLAGLLVLVVMKLLWTGTGLLVVSGLLLVAALAMELRGLSPFVLDVPVFVLHLLKAGYLRLADYFDSLKHARWWIPRSTLLQYGIPLGVVCGFSGIFIMANPDIARLTGDWLSRFAQTLADAFSRFTPSWTEAVFWLVTAWLFAGLLQPVMTKSVLSRFGASADKKEALPAVETTTESPMYAAYANTLAAVIVLFTVYLGFEFSTLWMREFPEGFHYSGYAHEGAAWLTIALALATLLLSVIFRGDVMKDRRLPRLRCLAWIWSGLNLLLAMAVYHRLVIYVEFNGMTRMRTVGFFGITSVVIGFVLVVKKITTGRDFLWLIRRQLAVLAFAVVFYLVMPVDNLVHRYNVQRILAGDPAPSVQISVHPIDAGGDLELMPLLNCENAVIREGIRALLAEKAGELEKTLKRRDHQGWTSFQRADRVLARELEATSQLWSRYENAQNRRSALSVFHEYAYQWY